MGYATIASNSNKDSDIQFITCTKQCQPYQHQVSIKTGLMVLVAKKFDSTYLGWNL